MHEATIAAHVLALLTKRLDDHEEAERVLSCTIRVGEFRNVEADSLSFAFDCMKQSFSGCRDCVLKIELIRASALCKNQHEYEPVAEHFFACPTCDAGIAKLVSGRELDIVGVTLETEQRDETEVMAKEEDTHARIGQ